jgi:AraC-like DNA-binding protein
MRALKEAGIDPAPLLARAGMSQMRLIGAPARVSAEGQVRFLELVAEALDNSLLGLHLAQKAELREFGVLYYVMASSTDLLEAIHHLARYLVVANQSVYLTLSEEKETIVLRAEHRISRHINKHFAEFGSAVVVRVLRGITGRNLAAKSVSFTHGRNENKKELDHFFGCSTTFGAPEDTLSLSTALLPTPTVTADQYLLKVLQGYCEDVLTDRGRISSTLRSMVEKEISKHLPHGQAQIERVALNLGMSDRTLSRRLVEEGTTYAAILDELRRDLSRQYLRDSSLSLNQIAWLLGYSEVTSYNHAFRRWTGDSPAKVRKRGGSDGTRGAPRVPETPGAA